MKEKEGSSLELELLVCDRGLDEATLRESVFVIEKVNGQKRTQRG